MGYLFIKWWFVALFPSHSLYNSKKKVQTSTSNRKKQTKAVVPGSLKDRILKLQTKKQ